ncbi:MAG TPA: hypothetical protein VL358_00305 [Caulobacteraceae bacterium]|jgi:hypothetical protein|nr:hypothetical protein [Caulobacteraceae bacterium]
MEWPVTLAVTLALAVFAALCGWAGSRPPDPRRGPRLAPYRFLMMMGVMGLLLMAVHMLNLMGLKTGR